MVSEHPFAPGLARLAADEVPGRLPPVELWNPPYCGDSQMRIARDGRWFHQDAPMTRPGLVRLFSTLLRKDDEGFILVTPVEKLSILVEDVPFLAVLMAVEGEGENQRLIFTTNVGDVILAGLDHPMRFAPDAASGAPVPYLHVRGRLEARLARAVYYALVERAVTRGETFGVWSGGVYFAMERAP